VSTHRPPLLALWSFVFALGALAGLLWWRILDFDALPAPFALPWWLLSIGFAAAMLCMVHVTFQGEAHSIELNAVPMLLGLVFCSPAGLFAANLIALVVVLVVVKRQRPVKAAFNVANSMLELAVAVVVFRAVVGTEPAVSLRGWVACYAAMLVSFAASALGITTVISLSLRRIERSASLLIFGGAVVLVTTALGVLTVTIMWDDWRGLWLVVVAIGVAYTGLRAFTRLRNRYASLELLYHFTASVSGATDTDDVLRRTLERSRELMSAEIAELVVSLPEGGWMTKRLDGDQIVTEVDRTADPKRLESLILHAASPVLSRRNQRDAPLRTALADRGWTDIVASPFARDDGSSGALLVANRLGEVSTFDTEDMKVLETFARHTAIALRVGDLVDRLRAEAAEKEFSALHDSLTGLANRKLLVARLEELLLADTDEMLLGVFFMDLDRFKEVNDTLGHHTGDSLLIEVARRLTRVIGRRGLIARLGGDEFGLVVPGLASVDEAMSLARTIEKEIDTPFVIDQLSLEVQVSIGVALAPLSSRDPKILFQHADIAMYAAKDRRSGVELYDRSIDHSSTRRLCLAGDLRQAIDGDGLYLAFQPQVSLATRRIVSLEALARWMHPVFGPVSPDEFISLAEQSGMVHTLTRWAIKSSLEELVRWRRCDPDLRVSVNVSARNLIDVSLVTDVRNILREVGLPGEALTLEITESTVMAEPQRSIAVLDRLRELGVRFAIDDFGTGYSSLSYLKRLPVDEVKIDKSFVRDMAIDNDLASIVRSTIDLARNLGLDVVAEGVEDAATLHGLGELHCDVAQGFHLSRPLPADELDAWLAAWPGATTSA
jgi:diguanylate cyclase (GGDEF)-like protein